MEGSRPITLRIITPDRIIYDEVVNHVVLPGAEGEVGIFYKHIPFMTYIRSGNLQIHLQNKRIICMAIKGGMIEFKNDLLTVLTIKDITQDEISIKMTEEEENPQA